MKTIMTCRRARDRSRAPVRLGVAMALGVLALSLIATPARAESILIDLAGGVPVAVGGGWFEWTYNVSLTTDSSLNKGLSSGTDVWAPDFGEVYDFGPFKAGSVSFTATGFPAGLVDADFVVSTPLSDIAAETAIFGAGSSEVLADNPTQQNLKVAFDRTAPYVNGTGATIQLGVLKAQSLQSAFRSDTYIGTDTQSSGLSGKNSSSIRVPIVPTPQTVWGGMALLSVMGLVRARRLVGV